MGDLFESSNGDFNIKKEHINGLGDYVITAGLTNNGILGRTNIEARLFDEKTITIDMFGAVFFRQFKYKMVTHARVFALKPLFQITERQGLFLANSIHSLNKRFGYKNKCSWTKIKNNNIHLPTKNGQIDFDFMEDLIAELEAYSIAELEAYLKVTGLDDYELNVKELEALQKFENGQLEWGEYRLGDLFEKINTKNVINNGPGDLPATTATLYNNQIGRYISRENATILKNVFSATANGFGKVFYQPTEFTVLQDSYAFKFRNSNVKIEKIHSFIVTILNKIYSKYNWGNKSGWAKVQEEKIHLPTKDGQIDLEFIEILISAVQKIVIKDVVEYVKKR